MAESRGRAAAYRAELVRRLRIRRGPDGRGWDGGHGNDMFVLVKARRASSQAEYDKDPGDNYPADVLAAMNWPRDAIMAFDHGVATNTLVSETIRQARYDPPDVRRKRHTHGEWLSQYLVPGAEDAESGVAGEKDFLMLGRIDTNTPHGLHLANRIKEGLIGDVSLSMGVDIGVDDSGRSVGVYRPAEVSFTRLGRMTAERGGVHSTHILAWATSADVAALGEEGADYRGVPRG